MLVKSHTSVPSPPPNACGNLQIGAVSAAGTAVFAKIMAWLGSHASPLVPHIGIVAFGDPGLSAISSTASHGALPIVNVALLGYI